MSPGFVASALNWSIRLLAAVFIAGILPSSSIDPVTSSASATRMRTLPQAVVELVPKSSLGKPATFMKSVVTLPDPLTSIVEPYAGAGGIVRGDRDRLGVGIVVERVEIGLSPWR